MAGEGPSRGREAGGPDDGQEPTVPLPAAVLALALLTAIVCVFVFGLAEGIAAGNVNVIVRPP